MPNILTDAEAGYFVRTTSTDSIMLQLLPMVDEYIKRATGRDWSADTTINKVAKLAAGALLTAWYDNPGSVGSGVPSATGALTQLEAEAAKYRKYEFRGLNGSGYIFLGDDVCIGDDVVKLVGVYGVSGTQVSSFESKVSTYNSLRQTNSADLSGNKYVVILKSPAEDVIP